MSFATYVLDKLDSYSARNDWWWGWTLAWGVARSLVREEFRIDHNGLVGRCVRVARHLRDINGDWPAEILVRNGSSVEFIQVDDWPPASVVFDANEAVAAARRVTIKVGKYRWRGDDQPPVDTWAYRASLGGEIVEFVAPR